jgi:hypothetical protein
MAAISPSTRSKALVSVRAEGGTCRRTSSTRTSRVWTASDQYWVDLEQTSEAHEWFHLVNLVKALVWDDWETYSTSFSADGSLIDR